MSKKSKKRDKEQTEISVSVDIELSEEARVKKVTKQQFYKALDKVIESDKKQDSEDS